MDAIADTDWGRDRWESGETGSGNHARKAPLPDPAGLSGGRFHLTELIRRIILYTLNSSLA